MIYRTPLLPLNTWSHLATTYDGAYQRVYINGVQVASRAQTGAVTVSAKPLRTRGNTSWPNEWFGGRIDEVQVYSRALSLAEIQEAMTIPVSGIN